MSRPFFAYGTLLLPEVMEAVCGRPFPSREATLSGYARYTVRGQVYPGLVACPGARTPGRLYLGIDAATWARLDRYEGSLYERVDVRVEAAGGKHERATTYVIPAHRRAVLSTVPWDPERFAAEHLPAYLAACRAFGSDRPPRA